MAAAPTGVLADLHDATDEDLVARYQVGDHHAIDLLLVRYRPFTHMKARQYFLAGGGRDDVVQEGMIGLYKAIRDYTPDKNASFRTFADLCITRQIVSAIKTATRHKHEPLNTGISLSKPVSDGDPDHVLADVLPGPSAADPCEVVIRDEEIAGMRRVFAEVLSDFEAEVLLLYVEGKSYAEIAASLGCRAKSIDNALQRIKRKLELGLRGQAGTRRRLVRRAS